jgi:uncharacterized membrane protein YhiD involved in acid resistance
MSKHSRDLQKDWREQKAIRRFFALGFFFLCLFTGAASSPLLAQSEDNKPRNARPDSSATNANRQQVNNQESLFSRLFDFASPSDTAQESLPVRVAKLSINFFLAALLSAAVAFRPRKKLAAFQANPYVAQTQILLSVVAAAMMMIVSDNAARAFGMFAAASLVRYRTNIRDPKETSVLLACLGIGLAAGVGRWEIALVLTVFIMLLLLILESYEAKQVFRTMELKVKSRDVEKTDGILKHIFKKRRIQAELRKIDLPDEEKQLGTILYSISVNPSVSTDYLTEQIFAADPHNIDTVEWEQKKSNPDIYR